MHFGLRAARLVDALDRGGGQHADRDGLRDCRFAGGVRGEAEVSCGADMGSVVAGMAERVVGFAVARAGCGAGAAAGGGGDCGDWGGDLDCQREEGDGVFFCKAEGGGEGVLGGFEGAVEGGEGHLEVDGVVGLGGLDGVVFVEDGFLSVVVGMNMGFHGWKRLERTIERTLWRVSGWALFD